MKGPGGMARRRRVAQAVFLGACALGVLLMLEYPSSIAARTVALGGMAAAFSVARSLAGGPGRPAGGPGPSAPEGRSRARPGRLLWAAAGGLAAGAVASFWLMLADQAHGGRAVWPLYVFVGFILAGAAVWSVLGAKLMRW